MHVSKQTRYNIIHRDKEHNETLYLYCRHQLKHRKSRIGDAGRNLIPDRKGMEKRPPEYNGKTFGDWEMDTVLGKKRTGAILTFIERSTSFPIALKLKGGVENFNGLLRQFIPKGTDLKTVTNAMLDEYVDNIRSRPRKKLCFKSSKKCFFDQLKE